jgi:hypothetical protein
VSSPDFDRKKALEQQIELLELKKQRLEYLIAFARGIKLIGVRAVDFSAFDRSKLDEYAQRAKEQWGDTPEYKELKEKEKNRTPEEEQELMERFIGLFAEFGELKKGSPESDDAQAMVKKLQRFITENLYACTDKILSGLGRMYAGGGEIAENIDKTGGRGTAEFVSKAIAVYCGE